MIASQEQEKKDDTILLKTTNLDAGQAAEEVDAEEEEEEWIESPNGWGSDANADSDAVADTDAKDSAAKANDEDEDSTGTDHTGTGSENDNGNGVEFLDLFGETNPRDCFTFDFFTTTNSMDDNGNDSIKNHAAVSDLANENRRNKIKIKITLEGYKLDSDETAQSTGVTLWQAAPRLAQYLVDHANDNSDNSLVVPLVANKSVLELGAGLGLCGIVAHRLGAAHVMLTDGDTAALKQMRHNVQLNLNNCSTNTPSSTNNTNTSLLCRQLFWANQKHMDSFLQSSPHQAGYDVILGADVVYTRESLEPLFDTVVTLLKKASPHQHANNVNGQSQFILSRHTRWNNVSDDTIIQAAQDRGLTCHQPEKNIYVFTFV
jgi:predicted nicotinamide N-methyase